MNTSLYFSVLVLIVLNYSSSSEEQAAITMKRTSALATHRDTQTPYIPNSCKQIKNRLIETFYITHEACMQKCEAPIADVLHLLILLPSWLINCYGWCNYDFNTASCDACEELRNNNCENDLMSEPYGPETIAHCKKYYSKDNCQ